MAELLPVFQQSVLDWYKRNGRKLPWRQTTDPYRILVSEVMLQQTQVDRVLPKYEAWLKQFPTTADLAAASPAAVITAWAGLGYNRRARYLQRTAQAVTELGHFPRSFEELKKLPGLGPYTAAAVLSFAFNEDCALVDTNIKRIYQLLIFGDQHEPTDKQVKEVATQFLPLGRSRDWHNALMDIGTIISKARSAQAQQEKLIELLPSLKEFNLPTLSDLPLKRPRQSDFKTSKRYWRGRIIQELRQVDVLSYAELQKKLGPLPYDLQAILSDLMTDGLLSSHDDIYRLPHEA